MRSFSKCAAWALSIIGLPLLAMGFAVSVSSGARAERALDDISASAFKIFDSSSERGERSSRRARATSSESDDDQSAPSRRRARVASRSDGDDEPAPARRRAWAVAQSSAEDEPRPYSRRSKGRQVASLGGGDFSAPKPSRSLSGGGNISWAANSGCLNGTLRGVVASVAANYGSVTVNSTCRSAGHNARVGGAPKSYHLTGNAVDFRVHGNIGAAASYLASLGGGYKHYGGGLFHVDTGPRRPF